jgi:hypothetical protein
MDAKRKAAAFKVAGVGSFCVFLIGLFHFANVNTGLRIVPKESWTLADTVVHVDELSEMGPELAESKHPGAVKALRKAGLLLDPTEEALKAERARIDQLAEERRAADQAKERVKAAAAKAAEKALLAQRGPKPVAYGAGSVAEEVREFLRATLNDYDSMKTESSSDVVPYAKDKWAQALTFRAKNGFGGYVLNKWIFVIRDGRVVDVIDQLK